MSGVHAGVGPLLAVGLLVLAVLAAAAALTGRAGAWVERVRLLALAVVVGESAIGLALALRGAAPSEWIHWPYAVAAGVALLLPGMLRSELTPTRRAAAVALAAVFALAMSWRLTATG
ncbi:MAG TPA: hypothetical protein VHK06_04070 [Candidatus Limnocylindria bacterium]|nr:hypothetical protein [Candidatus Limnocylindria bacterium]